MSYFSNKSSLVFHITQIIIYSIHTEYIIVINITKALLQWEEREQDPALTVRYQWVNSAFSPRMNEMVCVAVCELAS